LLSSFQHDAETVLHLKSEVAMALGNEHMKENRTICDDAAMLYVLIASLLLEQLEAQDASGVVGLPQAVRQRGWQLEEMSEILERRHHDSNWERCFVANWPVYTAGFFVTEQRDIDLIREDLSGRWAKANFAQVARYREDLERTWARRGFTHSAVSECIDLD
jgi:hypothetical protein